MSGFFFGPRERKLFGYYHAPAAVELGQVLICQPWGVEYELAHRTLHFLARRLAERGWHVLRFDYRGTGDSWGESTVGDLDAWADDTVQAARELKVITGLEDVDAVGLRLGATICASASDRLCAGGRRVLWDPVVSGARWMGELEALDVPDEPGLLPPGPDELGRYEVSEAFRDQLARLVPSTTPYPDRRSLLLWTQSGSSGCWGDGAASTAETLPQPAPWVQDVALGSGQIPVDAVTRIVEWLEE